MPASAQTQMTVDEFLATAEERAERMVHSRVRLEAVIALRNAIRKAGLSCEAVTDSLAVRVATFTA